MRVRITRWGHSLGLRIPRAVAEDLGLDEGATVEVKVVGGDFVVHPVRYTLGELIAAITPENVHGETDWGGPAGHEAW